MADKRAYDPLGYRLDAPTIVERVCVSIPVQLIPHLLGVIEPLRWPDAWQGEASAINDTTREIEDLFFRLITREECNTPDCEDCPDCPESENGCTGGALIESEEDMGQVVTDIQIVGGQIRVFFGPCCYKDLGTIEEIAEGDGEGVTPPWDEVYPDGPVYSACAKATAIVDAIYDLVEAGFTQTNDAPWNWVSHIESDFGYNLDDNHTLNMMGAIMFAYLTNNLSFGDTNNSTQRQRIKSKVAALLADDGTGVPSADVFEAIKNAFSYEMTFETYAGIYYRAIDAIGRSDLDSIAKMGAIANPANDCEAPQEIVPVGDVYFRGDFITTGQPGDKGYITVTAISDDAKTITCTLTQEVGEEEELCAARGYFPLVVLGAKKRIVFEYTGELPYVDWSSVAYPPVDPAWQQHLLITGYTTGGPSTAVNVQENVAGLKRAEYVMSTNGIPWGLGSLDNIKMPGGGRADRPTQITFSIRVVSYDVV